MTGTKRKRLLHKNCKICGGTPGVMTRFRLNVCRRCFKEMAVKLGFRKYD